MRNFEYFTPTRVIFGKDTHLKIGTVLKEQNCSKVLIHYGSHSAVSSGLIDEIRSSLDEAGISYVTLGGVVPNPRLSKVREGIELCRKEQVDFLLAVGGGSVIDSCKAIGYGLANPDTDVWNFFLRTETPKACLPVVSISSLTRIFPFSFNSAPVVEELAEAGYEVGKVDVDKEPSLAQQYKIMSIPTLLVFKEGKETARFVGLTSKTELEAALQ